MRRSFLRRFGNEGFDVHGRAEGSAMDGGSLFKFNEA